MKQYIPEYIIEIVNSLQNKGFEAQIVGGSVRDLLLGKIPKDWDLNTNAKPEEILPLFPDAFYENEFGTVGIKIRKSVIDNSVLLDKVSDETQVYTEIVEVTPYRKEGIYKDGRRPEDVTFDASLEEDLKRRDFTINAIAYNPTKNLFYYLGYDGKLATDLREDLKDIVSDINNPNTSIGHSIEYKGHSLKDIKNKLIRAVGKPEDRFEEDRLRMLRAVRFSAQLGFAIEQNTLLAIKSNSSKLSAVSRERVRDEFSKLLMSSVPDGIRSGIEFLRFTELLNDFLPELLLGLHMKQTANHKHDVYNHLLWSAQHAADKNYSLDMRIAALLHDIAKPHTARLNKETGRNTFYGHEVVGEKVSREILTRLKYPKELIEKVCRLVRWHMFNSDPDQVTMSAVRRMVANVGKENIWDLMNLRFCDRIGSGRPVEEPHRLRRYFAMLEQALIDPIDLKMLKINGNTIMEVTHETPGPRLRHLLFALFGEVLENPALNTEDYLVSRVTELAKLSTPELIELAKKGELEQEELEEAQQKDIKKKHRV